MAFAPFAGFRGLLAPQQPVDPMQQGLLAPQTGFMSNPNAMMLMGLGSGLLNHRANAQNTIGDAFQGAMQGAQVDAVNKRTRSQEALESQKINMTRAFLKSKGLAADQAEEDFLIANPSALGEKLQQLYNPPKPERSTRYIAAGGGKVFDTELGIYAPLSAVEGGTVDAADTGMATETLGPTPGDYKLPANHRFKDASNPSLGVEPIPGGPAEQTAEQRNAASKAEKAHQVLTAELDNYEKLVEKEGVAFLPGKEKDAIQQARRNIQLQAKELYNLGVLNGPDLAIMDQMLFDPSINNPVDALTTPFTDVQARTKASVKSLKAMMTRIKDAQTGTTTPDLHDKYGLER